MRLWTIQPVSVIEKLEEQQEFYAQKPDGIYDFVYHWFLSTTKFYNWPIWCWLNVPPISDLEKYCNKIYENENEKSYLLRLSIPNNKKMIFIPESAWDYVTQYKYLGEQKETDMFYEKINQLAEHMKNTIPLHDILLHQEIEKSWQKIFNFKWYNEKFKDPKMRVCISSLHSHWIEKKYSLTNVFMKEEYDYLTLKA